VRETLPPPSSPGEVNEGWSKIRSNQTCAANRLRAGFLVLTKCLTNPNFLRNVRAFCDANSTCRLW